MFRSPPSKCTGPRARRGPLARSGVLACALALLVSSTARASDADEPIPESEHFYDLSQTAIELTTPDDRWRRRGLAFVELPFGLRARFETSYTRHLYSSDILSQRFVNDFGPGIQADRSLESRIALSRTLARGVEFELAWESRNRLAPDNLMGFGRQTIGALVRIAR